MISEFFIGLGTVFVDWFLGLFGTADPPEWLAAFGEFITDIVHRGMGLGAWVPFALLGALIVWQLGAWFVYWLVKGIRWIWGLTPLSGGS